MPYLEKHTGIFLLWQVVLWNADSLILGPYYLPVYAAHWVVNVSLGMISRPVIVSCKA